MNARRKKGELTPQMLVILTLLIVFLIFVSIGIIKPLFSKEFQLGAAERWCQITIVIKNALPQLLEKGWYPICSSERIKLSKDSFEKSMVNNEADDDSVKEGGMRQILDLMRRCKFIVGGDKKMAIFAGKNCYICYTVETGENDGIYSITGDEFKRFVLEKHTNAGDNYLRDMQSAGSADLPHVVILPNVVKENDNYAIVYVNNIKPGDAALWINMGGACVLGAKIGTFIPKVGTAGGCVAFGAVAAAKTVYDLTEPDTNRLIFTELENLKEKNSANFECAGYEY